MMPVCPSRRFCTCLMRPSMPICAAMVWMPGASNVAASPIGSGYSVTPSLMTPWRASLHHWYAGILSRGTAAELFCISEAFSASVMRCTRSVARCSGESWGFM